MISNQTDDRFVFNSRYYSLDVSYFKSILDKRLLESLWNRYWVNTLSSSSLLTVSGLENYLVIRFVSLSFGPIWSPRLYWPLLDNIRIKVLPNLSTYIVWKKIYIHQEQYWITLHVLWDSSSGVAAELQTIKKLRLRNGFFKWLQSSLHFRPLRTRSTRPVRFSTSPTSWSSRRRSLVEAGSCWASTRTKNDPRINSQKRLKMGEYKDIVCLLTISHDLMFWEKNGKRKN